MNELRPRRGGISLRTMIAIALALFICTLCLIAAVDRAERARSHVADLVETPRESTGSPGSSEDRKDAISPGGDPLAEISSETCHEIFAAYHQVRTNAEEAAEALYPLNKAPGDPASLKLYHSRRDSVIEATEEAGRRTLLNRYAITAEQLDAIDDEGLTHEWSYVPPETVEQDAARGLVIKRRGGGRGRSSGGGRRR